MPQGFSNEEKQPLLVHGSPPSVSRSAVVTETAQPSLRLFLSTLVSYQKWNKSSPDFAKENTRSGDVCANADISLCYSQQMVKVFMPFLQQEIEKWLESVANSPIKTHPKKQNILTTVKDWLANPGDIPKTMSDLYAKPFGEDQQPLRQVLDIQRIQSGIGARPSSLFATSFVRAAQNFLDHDKASLLRCDYIYRWIKELGGLANDKDMQTLENCREMKIIRNIRQALKANKAASGFFSTNDTSITHCLMQLIRFSHEDSAFDDLIRVVFIVCLEKVDPNGFQGWRRQSDITHQWLYNLSSQEKKTHISEEKEEYLRDAVHSFQLKKAHGPDDFSMQIRELVELVRLDKLTIDVGICVEKYFSPTSLEHHPVIYKIFQLLTSEDNPGLENWLVTLDRELQSRPSVMLTVIAMILQGMMQENLEKEDEFDYLLGLDEKIATEGDFHESLNCFYAIIAFSKALLNHVQQAQKESELLIKLANIVFGSCQKHLDIGISTVVNKLCAICCGELQLDHFFASDLWRYKPAEHKLLSMFKDKYNDHTSKLKETIGEMTSPIALQLKRIVNSIDTKKNKAIYSLFTEVLDQDSIGKLCQDNANASTSIEQEMWTELERDRNEFSNPGPRLARLCDFYLSGCYVDLAKIMTFSCFRQATENHRFLFADLILHWLKEVGQNFVESKTIIKALSQEEKEVLHDVLRMYLDSQCILSAEVIRIAQSEGLALAVIMLDSEASQLSQVKLALKARQQAIIANAKSAKDITHESPSPISRLLGLSIQQNQDKTRLPAVLQAIGTWLSSMPTRENIPSDVRQYIDINGVTEDLITQLEAAWRSADELNNFNLRINYLKAGKYRKCLDDVVKFEGLSEESSSNAAKTLSVFIDKLKKNKDTLDEYEQARCEIYLDKFIWAVIEYADEQNNEEIYSVLLALEFNLGYLVALGLDLCVATNHSDSLFGDINKQWTILAKLAGKMYADYNGDNPQEQRIITEAKKACSAEQFSKLDIDINHAGLILYYNIYLLALLALRGSAINNPQALSSPVRQSCQSLLHRLHGLLLANEPFREWHRQIFYISHGHDSTLSILVHHKFDFSSSLSAAANEVRDQTDYEEQEINRQEYYWTSCYQQNLLRKSQLDFEAKAIFELVLLASSDQALDFYGVKVKHNDEDKWQYNSVLDQLALIFMAAKNLYGNKVGDAVTSPFEKSLYLIDVINKDEPNTVIRRLLQRACQNFPQAFTNDINSVSGVVFDPRTTMNKAILREIKETIDGVKEISEIYIEQAVKRTEFSRDEIEFICWLHRKQQPNILHKTTGLLSTLWNFSAHAINSSPASHQFDSYRSSLNSNAGDSYGLDPSPTPHQSGSYRSFLGSNTGDGYPFDTAREDISDMSHSMSSSSFWSPTIPIVSPIAQPDSGKQKQLLVQDEYNYTNNTFDLPGGPPLVRQLYPEEQLLTKVFRCFYDSLKDDHKRMSSLKSFFSKIGAYYLWDEYYDFIANFRPQVCEDKKDCREHADMIFHHLINYRCENSNVLDKVINYCLDIFSGCQEILDDYQSKISKPNARTYYGKYCRMCLKIYGIENYKDLPESVTTALRKISDNVTDNTSSTFFSDLRSRHEDNAQRISCNGAVF